VTLTLIRVNTFDISRVRNRPHVLIADNCGLPAQIFWQDTLSGLDHDQARSERFQALPNYGGQSNPRPTKVIVEPGKQEFFIIREFDAPRELVFNENGTGEIRAARWRNLAVPSHRPGRQQVLDPWRQP
jgi:hypothetical protein